MLVVTGSEEFYLLGIDLCLFHLHVLTLCTLIRGIFSHKTHAAEHLGETIGTEDEHQFALEGLVTMHITHRFHVFLLALIQLFLQNSQVSIEHLNLDIQRGKVFANGIYGTAFLGYLGIENHQVLKPFLDIKLIRTQLPLLLLDLLLYLLTLALQTLHGDRLSRRLPGGSRLLFRSLLSRLLLDNSRSSLALSGTPLLGIRTQGKSQ